MKARSYAQWFDPTTNSVIERDSFSCCHCNAVVFVPVRSTNFGFCRMCNKNLCTKCADLGTCSPFEKKLEAMERRERLLKAL